MMLTVQLDLNEKQILELEQIAKHYGFQTIADYLRMLIESRLIGAKVAANALEEDGVDIRENIEEAFYEAFMGQTMTLEEFWASLDDDDEGK